MKLQTFLRSGKKHENSDLVLPFASFLPVQLTGKDRYSNAFALFQVRTSPPPPPNQIIVQSAWNESAEQEKLFDMFCGGGGDDLR